MCFLVCVNLQGLEDLVGFIFNFYIGAELKSGRL